MRYVLAHIQLLIKIVMFELFFSIRVKQLENPERIFTKLDIREFY
jgi:hypothetical protein